MFYQNLYLPDLELPNFVIVNKPKKRLQIKGAFGCEVIHASTPKNRVAIGRVVMLPMYLVKELNVGTVSLLGAMECWVNGRKNISLKSTRNLTWLPI